MLSFFGNIARAVPRGYRAAAAEAPAGTPEVAAAGAPPARVPAAMLWPENLMDCAVLSVTLQVKFVDNLDIAMLALQGASSTDRIRAWPQR